MRRRPAFVIGCHPRHIELDCFHPALRVEGGQQDGEIWYLDCIRCSTSKEAENMSSCLLAMNPSPFDRATKIKAEYLLVNIVEYQSMNVGNAI